MKLDLDIEQFWKDEELTHAENCFSKSSPQVALGIRMSEECVFAELGEEGEPWGYTSPERRYDLNCRYNEKAIQIVGRPLLPENKPQPQDTITIPEFRPMAEICACRISRQTKAAAMPLISGFFERLTSTAPT